MAGSSDLIVKPSYIFTENDIITVDKLNLAATPVVELALQDPVNDQNYLRNGNFYSSFWTTPTGMNRPAGCGHQTLIIGMHGPVMLLRIRLFQRRLFSRRQRPTSRLR